MKSKKFVGLIVFEMYLLKKELSVSEYEFKAT